MKYIATACLILFSSIGYVFATEMTVYKSPYCGCCKKWIEHMEDNGFEVESVNKNNMKGIKDKYGVPSNLQSCHTAVVDDYVIEGHVPAADVLKLVSKKRHIKGLATPGMPQSAPGMDIQGTKDYYQVIAFKDNGKQRIVSEYNK